MGPAGSVIGWPTCLPVARSHTRTVWSPLPETTTGRPSSSAAATAFTALAWPVNSAREEADVVDGVVVGTAAVDGAEDDSVPRNGMYEGNTMTATSTTTAAVANHRNRDRRGATAGTDDVALPAKAAPPRGTLVTRSRPDRGVPAPPWVPATGAGWRCSGGG